MDNSVIIGSIGVSLLLLAFFLNLFKLLKQDSKTYIVMNIFGAAMSCYVSFLIDYIPFVVLEGTWTVVALVGLLFVFRKESK